MTHQALTTYRALLDAAAVAHYPGHTEWAERPNVQGYERNQWDYRPCADGSPAFVTVPTGERATMRIANNKARLEHMADHVRKHWTLYGGGPKPDDLKPKARKASAWPAGLVRCWLGQVEDKDHAGAMLTAEQLGGWYALVGNTPDSHARGFVAPQPVEGMPERIVSACRDDGRWVVMDRVSGLSLCNQKARSRAAAEADALDRTRETAQRRGTTPDALLSDALARSTPAADGLDQWRKRWDLVEVAPVAEQAQHVPEVAPVLDQVQPAPVAPVVADPAPVAPVLDQVQHVAPGYSLPEHVYDDWRGAESLAFVPNDRQRVVLQAVERALSEGLFYSTDIRARCAELLQPSDADKARGAGKVEGGYFGMDLYYARCSIKAQKRHQEQAETLRALSPTVGDVYGVLVFNDYKVSRACRVEEVSDEGDIVLSLCRGARAGWRVTVSAVQIAYAMDRAHEKGARRGGWKDWSAAHPVPEVAPVVDQVQPVPELAPVLDQVQPVPELAPVLDQVQPAPVAPVPDQVQPGPEVADMVARWRDLARAAPEHFEHKVRPALLALLRDDSITAAQRTEYAQALQAVDLLFPTPETPRHAPPPPAKPLQSTAPFRPALSHLRNTQDDRRRPAAGHAGHAGQPLQGHARRIRAGLGMPWAGLNQGSTGPGKHGPGHGPGPAAGAGNGPGKGPGRAQHGRRAGAATPPGAAGARLVQGTAAPGPGAPRRPPTCSGRPGRRAQAPPRGVAASADGVRGHSPPGVAASVHLHEHGPPEPQDLEGFRVPAFGVHFSPGPFHFAAAAFRRILTRRLTHDHQATAL